METLETTNDVLNTLYKYNNEDYSIRMSYSKEVNILEISLFDNF